MPRMARIVLPNHPHHVVQRGHNRQATFAEAADYERYLCTLREYKDEYRVTVLAWCLMTNHVHLLLSPNDSDGLGKLMNGSQTRSRRLLVAGCDAEDAGDQRNRTMRRRSRQENKSVPFKTG